MMGQRVDPDRYGYLRLPEGGFGRDIGGRWWVRPPSANMVRLNGHEVEEHPGGAITVRPSIEVAERGAAFRLENGIWRLL